ncbi:hypothetical protein AVEN_93987-1 [Araneus ventricosus]|uniref:Uncharacterized protein n=1 Tax=Araneus ventricosus TaxID=182803 RepID=A0A4Y2CJP2_ARAVE|nr:hypothetical protein AVEN_93987-1 [Araneus ventricosus]
MDRLKVIHTFERQRKAAPLKCFHLSNIRALHCYAPELEENGTSSEIQGPPGKKRNLKCPPPISQISNLQPLSDTQTVIRFFTTPNEYMLLPGQVAISEDSEEEDFISEEDAISEEDDISKEESQK